MAVVTNIGEGDHLGLNDIDDVETLAKVKRTIVDVVRRRGAAVLKADDPLVAAMAPKCPGSVIFFAQDGEDPVIVAHREAGAGPRSSAMMRSCSPKGDKETLVVDLADVPLTHGGRIGFQVENALAAAAAAWSLGMSLDVPPRRPGVVRRRDGHVPGRFNLLEVRARR